MIYCKEHNNLVSFCLCVLHPLKSFSKIHLCLTLRTIRVGGGGSLSCQRLPWYSYPVFKVLSVKPTSLTSKSRAYDGAVTADFEAVKVKPGLEPTSFRSKSERFHEWLNHCDWCISHVENLVDGENWKYWKKISKSQTLNTCRIKFLSWVYLNI